MGTTITIFEFLIVSVVSIFGWVLIKTTYQYWFKK